MSFSEGVSIFPHSLSASVGAADQPPAEEGSIGCRKEGCGILLLSGRSCGCEIPPLRYLFLHPVQRHTMMTLARSCSVSRYPWCNLVAGWELHPPHHRLVLGRQVGHVLQESGAEPSAFGQIYWRRPFPDKRPLKELFMSDLKKCFSHCIIKYKILLVFTIITFQQYKWDDLRWMDCMFTCKPRSWTFPNTALDQWKAQPLILTSCETTIHIWQCQFGNPSPYMASIYVSSDMPKINYIHNDSHSFQSHNDEKKLYSKFENN